LLTNVAFAPGSSISILGDFAFSWCSSLQSISLPSSIQALSSSCFLNCAHLASIVLEADSHLSTQ
jgi:hypothetical protein